MIRCNLPLIRVKKEQADGHKLPYRVIADETGLSTGVLTRLMRNEFDRIEVHSANVLCTYFGCSLGELFEFIPDAQASSLETALATH